MPSTARTGRRNNLKHLHLCFPNLKNSFTHESPPISPPATSSSHHHHQIINHHNRPSHSTTASSMINFNTLYDHTLTLEPEPEPEPEPDLEPEPAVIATAVASRRFFFSSPGRSNSIFDSTDTDTDTSSYSLSSSLTAIAPPPLPQEASTSTDDNNNDGERRLFFNGIVGVPTYSTDPYVDFRRSMQEMVEARPELIMMDVKSNWRVLHELLQCYLALNPKSTHKYIHGAFSDLLVALSSCSSCIPPPSPPSLPHDFDRDDVADGGGGGS